MPNNGSGGVQTRGCRTADDIHLLFFSRYGQSRAESSRVDAGKLLAPTAASASTLPTPSTPSTPSTATAAAPLVSTTPAPTTAVAPTTHTTRVDVVRGGRLGAGREAACAGFAAAGRLASARRWARRHTCVDWICEASAGVMGGIVCLVDLVEVELFLVAFVSDTSLMYLAVWASLPGSILTHADTAACSHA